MFWPYRLVWNLTWEKVNCKYFQRNLVLKECEAVGINSHSPLGELSVASVRVERPGSIKALGSFQEWWQTSPPPLPMRQSGDFFHYRIVLRTSPGPLGGGTKVGIPRLGDSWRFLWAGVLGPGYISESLGVYKILILGLHLGQLNQPGRRWVVGSGHFRIFQVASMCSGNWEPLL